jgi:Permeases of the drug/metabolite transporter (DMT) superfamily
MNYNKINNSIGWLCGLIATAVYISTLERTTSFWDTGEFIASAYKMQIVHQPGAPLFLMLQNVFSNLAFGNPERIAFWMNVGSALSSGLTIVFLYWSITALARKVIWKPGTELTKAGLIQIMGAGAVGALAYTFSDTFWFSAVESEVYAMSSLCTAVVFWAILKWEAHADEAGADRWLLFIAYIMGLSIGVHLLNLLAIPAIALVIYFRRTEKATSGGAVKALLISLVVVAVVLWGIIQYLIKFAANFDLFFVNTLGMGFGSGVLVFALLLVGGTAYGIWYSIQKAKPLLNIILLSFAFIVFGYSSFAMILIRAKANPTLNNSDPDNAFAFLSYLNREQYGDNPLFKGPYFDSRPIDVTYGSSIYRKGTEKYEIAGRNFDYEYDRETVFPRIYSNREPSHQQYYRSYLNLGENEQPTFGDNLRFFFSYQVGHMYGRYFLWNFVGRQNDQQGHGDLTTGNWVSGLKFIDQWHVGGQDALPESQLTDPSYNRFYFLPLILGLIGAFWHFKRRQRDAGVVGLLFFMTGLAIVLYLNQTPLQPRERDYAYAGSFYAFAIWIGLGVVGITDWLSKKVNVRTAGWIATVIGLLAGPIILAKDGWDDHDRSEKFLARDIAKNYLESCAPNAILFTYGDNDTYPLWYVQEVENVRPDIRIVNLSLLSADWYVRQMKDQVNEAAPLPITIPDEKYVKGVRDVIYYQDAKIPGSVELKNIVALMLSDNPNDKRQVQSEQPENFLPTKNLQLTINREDVMKHNVVPQAWQDSITNVMQWTYNRNYVSRAELAIMDILVNNNWERPIYFATTVPSDNFMGLDKYLVSEGFALRLMPINVKQNTSQGLVNADAIYDHALNKYVWGNIRNSPYLDPESYRMVSLILNNVYSAPAEALIAEGKKEEAKKLLNNALEYMPERIYRIMDAYGYSFLTENLYAVGETDKANALVERNVKYLDEQLRYFAAIAETKPNLEMQNIQYSMFTLNRFAEAAKEHGQTDLAARVEKTFGQYEAKFFGGAPAN